MDVLHVLLILVLITALNDGDTAADPVCPGPYILEAGVQTGSAPVSGEYDHCTHLILGQEVIRYFPHYSPRRPHGE